MASSKESISSSYGHYRIISKIGSGGMGAVYRAEDEVLNREVALKILLSDVARDQERIRRFVHEAKAASALNHPNILTIFEVGEAEGTYYLVTELIRGHTLRELMRKERVDVIRKVDIGIQVASALDAAHQHGLIHRDVKPENIMIRDDGLVKVLDFGLAKLTRPKRPASSDETTLEHHATAPGVLVGTTAYMSPEQARGLDLDGRSDAFSLGTVLYELFTGRHPFPGESHADVVSAILKENPAPISQRAPELPGEIERIVDKLLRKDRDTRYQDLKDLRLDLEDLRDALRLGSKGSHSKQQQRDLSTDSPSHVSVRSALTSNIVEKRRFTILHGMVFLAIAALGFVGLWFLWSKLYPPTREPGSYPTTEIASWNSAAGELFTDASFSPDGKLIAYTSTKSGRPSIWVTQTSSQNPIQITNDTFSNTEPIWSPNGDEVAFFSERTLQSGVKMSGIWRVPAFGGAPRFLGTVGNGSPDLRRWTASGNIYFQLDGNLHTLNTASGRVDQLTSFETSSRKWIAISRDEKKIATLAVVQGTWKITISDFDGSGSVEVDAGTGEVGGVAWDSEHDRLYYGSEVAGVMQIFLSSGTPGSAIRITAAETDVSPIDVSTDGQSIIVGSAKEESNLWRVGLNDGREVAVVRDIDTKLFPHFSPDGTRIAYQSARNLTTGNRLYESSIVLKEINATGEAVHQRVVTENGFLPIWSPDGTQIAFLRQSGNTLDLYVVNPDASAEAPAVTRGIPRLGHSVSPYNLLQPRAIAWSPDNSSIAYASDKGGTSNLWMLRLSVNADEPITTNTDKMTTYYSPFWSEDGTKLAFLYQTRTDRAEQGPVRGVRVLDLRGGETRDVYRSAVLTRLLGWLADGKRLLIAEGSRENSSQAQATTVRSVTIDGGAMAEIAQMPNAYYFNIFVSDDKKMIAYAARDVGVDDIWVVSTSNGTARKLTTNNDPAVYFSRLSWLHDGTSIVFGKQTRFSLLSVITGIE